MKVFSGSIGGSHSLIADDTAANYSSFSNGSISPASGGYGFANWSNFPQNDGGIFRGGVAGGFGNINTGGNSWGAYGNNTTGGTDGVDLRRNLNGALSVGFALSATMAVKYRSGAKGLSIYSDTNWSTELFNVNVGGDQYQIDNVNQGDVNYKSDMIIRVVLKQTSTTQYNYSVNFFGTAGGTQDITKTNTKTGVIRGFKFYAFEQNNLTPGEPNNDNNNLYYNSIDVYRY